MDNPRSPRTQKDWQQIGAASGIGCSVAGGLLLCIGGGILIDRWLGTEPVGVLVGMTLGLISAGYSLYELAVLGRPDRGVVRLDKKRDADDHGEDQA